MRLNVSRVNRTNIKKRRRAPLHSKASVIRCSCGRSDFAERSEAFECGFQSHSIIRLCRIRFKVAAPKTINIAKNLIKMRVCR